MANQGTAVRWWVPGDWNGFFGLFTNVVLNVIVLTTLCLFVVKLPDDMVFGRVLPALGIALPIGNLFYAYLAWQLARKEGRSDVTAMPYGPSVPHMFIVVFVIMLPTYLATKNATLAWQAGLAWAFIIGVIVLLGAFVGPWIREHTPRAAMLGTLAGISIAFISMRPAFQMWELPWVAFVCFAIVLIAWTANIRLPGGIPGGLAAVIIGAVIGWLAALLGWSDYMKSGEVAKSLEQFGLHVPLFSSDVFTGLGNIAPLLATAIPLGIYNFTEAMNNVESASAAGDNYNLRKILLADGLGAIVGSMLGSPFPPAVYIGHPGWKSVGGRISYSLGTGIAIALVCFLGLTALLLKVIPLVAILPILLYIGLVIGAQAFQASPASHAPAVVLAIIPNIAEWAKINIDGALGAAGTSAAQLGAEKLANVGVVYSGLATLGSGSVLAGMVLGAMAAFIIERQLNRAAVTAFAGAVLSWIGLIHAAQLGWGAAPAVALGYTLFGVVCLMAAGQAKQPSP
ncbi:MAG: regulator [Betaproteobacteria bacterium]|nr:regulator [Betaproteobacteria bacterium]